MKAINKKGFPRVLNLYGSIYLAILVLMIGGCTASHYPVFLHPSFGMTAISKVVVLPVVDHRANKELKTNINKAVNQGVKVMLEKKGYVADFATDFGSVSNITREDISNKTPSFISLLGPDNANWLLIIVVKRLDRDGVFLGFQGKASVSGYLFEKTTGDLYWEGEGTGIFGAGVLLAALVDDAALEEAVRDMMLAFPENATLPQMKPVKEEPSMRPRL